MKRYIHSSDDYDERIDIQDALEDMTYQTWDNYNYDEDLTYSDIAAIIKEHLADPDIFGFKEGKDFTMRDVAQEMNKYDWDLPKEIHSVGYWIGKKGFFDSSIKGSTETPALYHGKKEREDAMRSKWFTGYMEDATGALKERYRNALRIDWKDFVAEDSEDFVEQDWFPDLSIIKSVEYFKGSDQDWAEANGYESGFVVTYIDNDVDKFGWKPNRPDEIEEVFPI